MKDFYKQEIEKVAMEKIAARAWKKFLPGLSDKNYNRLLQSGVYNPERELQGLRRGTQNILAKNDAKMLRKPGKAGDSFAEAVSNDVKAKNKNSSITDESRQHLKEVPKEMYPFSYHQHTSTTPITSLNNKSTGFAYVPKGANNAMLKANPDLKQDYPNLTPISRRDRDGRKWNQAILERHEADEIRYGRANDKKGIGDKASYESHYTPKVMMQESANAALMPRSVKTNAIRNLRDATGETTTLQQISGVPYGSSAVYNKSAARRAEKNVLKQNLNNGNY